MRLSSRTAAGQALADRLAHHAKSPKTLVVALPRGGVVVAAEIAEALALPLDILVVRKLGVPWQPELAMGAIVSGGETVLNRELIEQEGISPEEIRTERETEERELHRREQAYRGDRPPLDVRGQTVILVDDGVATGATMEVAIQALRRLGVAGVVVAVGVAPPEALRSLRRKAEEVVCLLAPDPFGAISAWYWDFEQTTDDEVRALLARAAVRAQ
jgi:predicted phosphoribosyltransferase